MKPPGQAETYRRAGRQQEKPAMKNAWRRFHPGLALESCAPRLWV